MGGLVIEEIRPGVQFIPEAAAAFRRAEAQTQREFSRNIDVNSTYRSRSKQLSMFNAWQAYVGGRGPYPGHSKALHPDDPLAFHVAGTALDSDDWRNARIVQILAENGFIRNRLYVPNEEHHFEWIRSRDKNYGKKVDDVSAKEVWDYPVTRGGKKITVRQELADAKTNTLQLRDALAPVNRGGKQVSIRQEIADAKTNTISILAEVKALTAAVQALALSQGADPAAILKAVQDGVKSAMKDVSFSTNIDS